MDFSIINNFLIEANNYINLIVGGNEFAAGMVVAGLFGVITYMSRTIPSSLLMIFIKHTTTSLELNSTNDSYHHLAKYLFEKGFANKSRYIKVGNGRWGCEENSKELGYGRQIIWWNWYTPILINAYSETSESSIVKEFINLTKIGRSHLLFDEIIENLDNKNKDDAKTKFYKFSDDFQELITLQDKKNMDTVLLPKKSSEQLCNTIDNFIKKEEWFLKYQIPYQLGILLYGPPGTGKTSLIKAIAAYMDKDICFVENEVQLIKAAQKVSDAIIVVEEIDTLCTDSRDNEEGKKDLITSFHNKMNDYLLGRVLNAIDGIISNHGRIIIMTTNRVEVLDPALLRPGRIDLQLNVDYVCSEVFNLFLSRFFENYKEKEYVIKKEISPVMLQNDIILGLTVKELVEKYTEKEVDNISNFNYYEAIRVPFPTTDCKPVDTK